MKFKNYIDYHVYNVTPIKNGYGFRIVLTFADGTSKIRQHSGFTSVKQAQEMRDEMVGQLYSGHYILYENITLESFINDWFEEKKHHITYNTYFSYQNAIVHYIIPFFKNKNVRSLNQSDILKLYCLINANHPSVVPIAKAIMISALNDAKRNHLTSTNVAAYVRLSKSLVYKRKPIQTLTLPQVFQLIEVSKNTPIHLQILFAVLMGLRSSEIRGLKYSDIHYGNHTLTVSRQLGNKMESAASVGLITKQELPPKTHCSVRTLPIPNLVWEAILDARCEYEKNRSRRKKTFRDWDYICCSTLGNPRSKTFHYHHFKKLLNQLHLPNIRFHELRTTYSTMLLKQDFTSKAISKLLGHSNFTLAADIYGDKTELTEDCLKALEPVIEELVPKKQEDFNSFYDYSGLEEMIHLPELFL